MDFTDDELDTTLRVLQRIADDPARIADHARLKSLVAKISKQAKRARRQSSDEAGIAQRREARQRTGLVRAQLPSPTPSLPAPPEAGGRTQRSQRCYVCKRAFHELHHFYHLLCPACAATNWARRTPRIDLTGRIALVTGGRIKIGFQCALALLRNGARVIATTRFPRDAQRRFLAEPDAPHWRDRLTLEPLDLRRVPAVEDFAERLCATLPHLDIVINNAAQTIRRPREFYAELLASEPAPWLLEADDGPRDRALGLARWFPSGERDAHGQPLDKRPANSWSQQLHEISTMELLEVQLVNAVAPFLLTARLRPALLRSPHARRFVVQASAMEGQFCRAGKTAFHPHTNMAKASLNMLVRTSAQAWARGGIYMNAVDTGWITDERPYPAAMHQRETQDFHAPLDAVDGAARLLDPVVRGLADPDEPAFGHFLKDFVPHDW